MSKKINYKAAPKGMADAIESSRVIKDFLPAPHKLIENEETVKTTIDLSKRSINFFKLQAKKNNTSYQRMLRKVVDLYVNYHEEQLK